jgi:hypothetical protein
MRRRGFEDRDLGEHPFELREGGTHRLTHRQRQRRRRHFLAVAHEELVSGDAAQTSERC